MTWKEKTLSLKDRKELILKQVSILDVLRYYGIDFEGDKLVCPFPDHNDAIASFNIYRETNSFYCFGCSRGSNVIDFVMAMDNCEFVDAIVKLMPMRREENDLVETEVNFKDVYVFNMSCDVRDFLSGLKKFRVYEEERRRADVIFRKMDKKLKTIDKADEKALKRMHNTITDYIEKRREELMKMLDGYNEERI